MSGIYSVDDLLKLRASPLVAKPAGLRPSEEWMGAQETSSRRPVTRGKQEDPDAHSESFQKRPLLDGQSRKSTTDPERIVLGPPRRSFASSNARATAKTQDGSDETPTFKDRSSLHERSKNGESTDTRHHERKPANGRYAGRHDLDGEKPRRKYDDNDDGEPRTRRDYDRDRPKWGAREVKDDQQGLEEEEHTRGGSKRDPQARAKFEQPWFRMDRGAETMDEPPKDGDRTSGWGRDRGRERDYDRGARTESVPEWMDAEEVIEEPTQARTQEEFQRWKEKMKAGNGPTESKNVSAAPSPQITEEIGVKPAKAKLPEADDSMDKFFARFNESKATQEQKPAAVKAPAKTRFASLFSPPPEAQPKQAAPEPAVELPGREQSPAVHTTTPSNTDADQAGFARILEMLQTRGSNPTQQMHEASKTKIPLYARGEPLKSEPDTRPSSQNLMSIFAQEQQQSTAAQSRQPAGSERLAESRSPVESSHIRQPSNNKDELLMTLLRNANLSSKQQQQPQLYEQRPPIGVLSSPEAVNRAAIPRNQMVSPTQVPNPSGLHRREAVRSMFDDSTMHFPDDQGPREGLARRPTNGTGSTFYDDPYFAQMRSGPTQSQKQQVPQGLPPGLGRPPGLEQMRSLPPPGWSQQQQHSHPSLPQPPQQQQQQQPQQQQSVRQPGPPPGMPNLPRGMPQPYPAPQQQQSSQRPPQRKYTGDNQSMSSFPPGMGPPPGFISSGPPPGFPGMAGAGGMYGRIPAEQPRERGGGMFAEMYGDVGRPTGLRGAAPPGYR